LIVPKLILNAPASGGLYTCGAVVLWVGPPFVADFGAIGATPVMTEVIVAGFAVDRAVWTVVIIGADDTKSVVETRVVPLDVVGEVLPQVTGR